MLGGPILYGEGFRFLHTSSMHDDKPRGGTPLVPPFLASSFLL
jgi:hypothetical protein